jgi:hypothetical protein
MKYNHNTIHLSALIITTMRNNIKHVLEDLDFADEILVIDSLVPTKQFK